MRPAKRIPWIDAHVAYEGDDCLLWPFSRGPRGAPGQVTFEGKYQCAARIMCRKKRGPPPTPEHQSAHVCGNGHLACINPNHLVWKTRLENMQDMVLHGRSNRGIKAPSAKLSAADVLQIRAMEGRAPRSKVAVMFKISATQVFAIYKRQKWAWLE